MSKHQLSDSVSPSLDSHGKEEVRRDSRKALVGALATPLCNTKIRRFVFQQYSIVVGAPRSLHIQAFHTPVQLSVSLPLCLCTVCGILQLLQKRTKFRVCIFLSCFSSSLRSFHSFVFAYHFPFTRPCVHHLSRKHTNFLPHTHARARTYAFPRFSIIYIQPL